MLERSTIELAVEKKEKVNEQRCMQFFSSYRFLYGHLWLELNHILLLAAIMGNFLNFLSAVDYLLKVVNRKA